MIATVIICMLDDLGKKQRENIHIGYNPLK